MNVVFNEILLGVKRSIGLLNKKEKRSLFIATFLMLITGILTNGPAIILGKLVDQLVSGTVIQFAIVVPFILLLIVVILANEGLTVVLKYLIQNIATQTDKDQTVQVIERLLKVILAVSLSTTNWLFVWTHFPIHRRTHQSSQTYFFGFYACFLCRTGSHWHCFYRETADGLRYDSRDTHRVISGCQTSLFTERDPGCLIKKEGRVDGKVVEMLGALRLFES